MTSERSRENPTSRHRSAISHGRVCLRFLGRKAPGDLLQAARLDPQIPTKVSRLEQVHSAKVLPAREGLCGRGDGLWTSRANLALTIATADCVPLVVTDEQRLAVVHAGWRGIVTGIVAEALARFGAAGPPIAWIGPAIRGCCYEVDDDVAAKLVGASDRSCLASDAAGDKPRIDLVTAVAAQLRRAGVDHIHDLSDCTRCHSDEFWSYRRCGPGAGRNHTIAWLSDDAGASA